MIRNLKICLYLVLSLGAFGCGHHHYQSRSANYQVYRGSAPGSYSNGYGYNGYGSNGDCCGGCEPLQCSNCGTDMVSVVRSAPADVALGKEFTVTLTATARCNCTGVVIKEMLPNGLLYVSSTPVANECGCELSWDLGTLSAGECREISVTYRGVAEGCLCNCYSVCAAKVCSQCVNVGCPVLKICKDGPDRVRINCPVWYRITVSNEGCRIAHSVVVQDIVPENLQHESCMKTLCWEIGDLAPCQTKCFDVCFKAVKCGMACNTVSAQACDCPPVLTTASTRVEHCCVSVNKSGPTGPLVVGQNADYTITARNDGSMPLTNVKIVDTVPPGTRIKSAPGAEINGCTATWIIPVFPAEETMTFDITITSCVHGCLTNQVCATCNEEAGDCASVTTHWMGVAAVSVEVKGTNPVCVGNCAEYCIMLTNQGFADDTNAKIVVTFPEELCPECATGPTRYTIDGNVVTFEPLSVLGAGRTVAYSVRAKACHAGDARVKVQATSDLLRQPVTKEESTNVY